MTGNASGLNAAHIPVNHDSSQASRSCGDPTSEQVDLASTHSGDETVLATDPLGDAFDEP